MNTGQQATGELARLIATEHALETRVAAAKAEAERIVADAAAKAAGSARDLEAELSAARSRFEAELEAECRRRSDEVLVQGRADAARFAGFTDAQVDRLTDAVLRRMAEGAA